MSLINEREQLEEKDQPVNVKTAAWLEVKKGVGGQSFEAALRSLEDNINTAALYKGEGDAEDALIKGDAIRGYNQGFWVTYGINLLFNDKTYRVYKRLKSKGGDVNLSQLFSHDQSEEGTGGYAKYSKDQYRSKFLQNYSKTRGDDFIQNPKEPFSDSVTLKQFFEEQLKKDEKHDLWSTDRGVIDLPSAKMMGELAAKSKNELTVKDVVLLFRSSYKELRKEEAKVEKKAFQDRMKELIEANGRALKCSGGCGRVPSSNSDITFENDQTVEVLVPKLNQTIDKVFEILNKEYHKPKKTSGGGRVARRSGRYNIRKPKRRGAVARYQTELKRFYENHAALKGKAGAFLNPGKTKRGKPGKTADGYYGKTTHRVSEAALDEIIRQVEALARPATTPKQESRIEKLSKLLNEKLANTQSNWLFEAPAAAPAAKPAPAAPAAKAAEPAKPAEPKVNYGPLLAKLKRLKTDYAAATNSGRIAEKIVQEFGGVLKELTWDQEGKINNLAVLAQNAAAAQKEVPKASPKADAAVKEKPKPVKQVRHKQGTCRFAWSLTGGKRQQQIAVPHSVFRSGAVWDQTYKNLQIIFASNLPKFAYEMSDNRERKRQVTLFSEIKTTENETWNLICLKTYLDNLTRILRQDQQTHAANKRTLKGEDYTAYLKKTEPQEKLLAPVIKELEYASNECYKLTQGLERIANNPSAPPKARAAAAQLVGAKPAASTKGPAAEQQPLDGDDCYRKCEKEMGGDIQGGKEKYKKCMTNCCKKSQAAFHYFPGARRCTPQVGKITGVAPKLGGLPPPAAKKAPQTPAQTGLKGKGTRQDPYVVKSIRMWAEMTKRVRKLKKKNLNKKLEIFFFWGDKLYMYSFAAGRKARAGARAVEVKESLKQKREKLLNECLFKKLV